MQLEAPLVNQKLSHDWVSAKLEAHGLVPVFFNGVLPDVDDNGFITDTFFNGSVVTVQACSIPGGQVTLSSDSAAGKPLESNG